MRWANRFFSIQMKERVSECDDRHIYTCTFRYTSHSPQQEIIYPFVRFSFVLVCVLLCFHLNLNGQNDVDMPYCNFHTITLTNAILLESALSSSPLICNWVHSSIFGCVSFENDENYVYTSSSPQNHFLYKILNDTVRNRNDLHMAASSLWMESIELSH